MTKYIPALVYIILDVFILYVLLLIAGIFDNALIPFMGNQPVAEYILNSLSWLPAIYIIIFIYKGVYSVRVPFDNQLRLIVSSMLFATVLAIVLLFLNKSWHVPRLFLIVYLLLSILLFPVVKLLYMWILAKFSIFQKRLLVIGAGEAASILITQINNNTTMGYRIIGILDDDKTKHGTMLGGHKILGGIPKIRRFNLKNTDVIIAIPTLNRHQMITLLSICQKKADNVKVMPDLTGIPVNAISIEEFFDGQTVLLSIKNNLKSLINLFIKRIFDIIVGIIFLPLIIFVFMVISIAIVIESPGAPIYSGLRLGKNGRLFKCYKFRSMFINGDELLEKHLNDNPIAREEWETYKKLRDFDPRVTRIGKFMRKTSLDELPQIINVIRGEMSLVGPRPYLEREKLDMGKSYEVIEEVTPGVTGLWQVKGRNQLSFQQRLELDEYYVRNWSIWLDIMILIMTVKVVLLREGAS